MCAMYYPESAIIASKNSHLADVVQKVDRFLYERQGKAFYAGTAADDLRAKLTDIQGILNLYKRAGVLSERKVWLCPKHNEEIDPVRDDVFHCPTCGRNYRETQCKQNVLYSARRVEATDALGEPDTSNVLEQTESTSQETKKNLRISDANKNRAEIFVSYSRADRQFIEQFTPLIRQVYGNDSLWFDEDIHGGADWWKMILEEIGKCDLFIYLISNESLESPYCQAELREALRLNKQVLPVIVRRLKPPYPGNIDSELADTLRKTQYVDMTGGFNNANTISKLYAAINRLVGADKNHDKSLLSVHPTPEPSVPDKRKVDSNIRAAYIGGAFLLVSVLIAGIFGLWQGVFANSTSSEDTLTEIVEATELPFVPTMDVDEVQLLNDIDAVFIPSGFVSISFFDRVLEMGQAGGRPIDGFAIDRTEVTHSNFTRWILSSDSIGLVNMEQRRAFLDTYNEPDHPVTGVSPELAQQYCEAHGGDLPGATQWLYAAYERREDYPWSTEQPEANIGQVFNTTVSVKSYAASTYGLYDMGGNASEWVRHIDGTNGYALMGGSFNDPVEDARRGAIRYAPTANDRTNAGFRCVYDIAINEP